MDITTMDPTLYGVIALVTLLAINKVERAEGGEARILYMCAAGLWPITLMLIGLSAASLAFLYALLKVSMVLLLPSNEWTWKIDL